MKKRRGNGEGTVYYSSKVERWVGQFINNGKRKSVYGKTKAEVEEKLHKGILNQRTRY